MSKLKIFFASSAGIGIIAASAFGIASASTTNNSNNSDIGSSGIPRTTFRSDRLEAAAAVLNTSSANILAAHKDKTLKQLIKNAGFTPKTFSQKVKAQLVSELEGQGFTQDQVTIALQHQEIVRLHYRLHKLRT